MRVALRVDVGVDAKRDARDEPEPARDGLDAGKLALPARKDLPDAAAWVRTQFLRLFGREASEGELSEFTRVLAAPVASSGTASTTVH